MTLVPGTTPGLTAPVTRARSTGFVTDVLVQLGSASEERVQQAIDEARTAGHPPEHLLLEQGAISPEQLSKAVAERYGLDHVDLSLFQVDMAAANLISVGSARRYSALPIAFVDKDDAPGRHGGPDQPARARRHQNGDRATTATSPSPPAKTSSR